MVFLRSKGDPCDRHDSTFEAQMRFLTIAWAGHESAPFPLLPKIVLARCDPIRQKHCQWVALDGMVGWIRRTA